MPSPIELENLQLLVKIVNKHVMCRHRLLPYLQSLSSFFSHYRLIISSKPTALSSALILLLPACSLRIFSSQMSLVASSLVATFGWRTRWVLASERSASSSHATTPWSFCHSSPSYLLSRAPQLFARSTRRCNTVIYHVVTG